MILPEGYVKQNWTDDIKLHVIRKIPWPTQTLQKKIKQFESKYKKWYNSK